MINNENMPTIAVLMSTYNGEKYLDEQISSILKQENVEVKLYIRDDGSTDRTITIIKKYSHLENVYYYNDNKNLGVGNSFMFMLYSDINAEYYSFADQDDIWLENKLISAVTKLKQMEGVALYAGNQILIDENGNKLGLRYSAEQEVNYHQIVCGNPFSGCTMVFNDELCKLMRDKKRIPSDKFFSRNIHDVWLAMVASVVGQIYFDMEGYILYRQHAGNVVGAYSKTTKNILIEQFKKIFSSQHRNLRSERSREVCERFPEYIVGEKTDLLNYGYYMQDKKKKKELLEDDLIRNYSKESKIGFSMKIILNLF